jgi:hypothetical protein
LEEIACSARSGIAPQTVRRSNADANSEGTDDLKSRLEIARFNTKFDLHATDNPELELKFIEGDDTDRGQAQKQRHYKGISETHMA